MKLAACLVVATLLCSIGASAKRPQILPEPMLINLFALTEASAALRICADSKAYSALTANEKALLARLQGGIDGLVRKIAQKFDPDLFPFFEQSRDEAAKRPDRVESMRQQYAYCGEGMLERMQGFVYNSRQKLDYFLSQQPDAQ